jgi:phosphoribosylglycinamide formyltransferase-1
VNSLKIGVLISGSGSNLQALIDDLKGPQKAGQIAVVISDKRDAYGLKRATDAGIEALYMPKRKDSSRQEYDKVLSEALSERGVEWIVCAGFMRILGESFVQKWKNRVINIHPAILPSFPGTDAVQQAIDAGVRVAGATVHFIDEGTDTGPIIAQSAVAVGHGDTVEMLKAKILATEHKLLPMAVQWAIQGHLSIVDGCVSIAGVPTDASALIVSSDVGD